MNKTLYIQPEDQTVWARAAALAKRRRISLSRLVAAALDEYTSRRGAA